SSHDGESSRVRDAGTASDDRRTEPTAAASAAAGRSDASLSDDALAAAVSPNSASSSRRMSSSVFRGASKAIADLRQLLPSVGSKDTTAVTPRVYQDRSRARSASCVAYCD